MCEQAHVGQVGLNNSATITTDRVRPYMHLGGGYPGMIYTYSLPRTYAVS